ncbi:MAG: ATP-binding protein [Erysipelotrichaceae bacterium]|nr:ATP-binding protein [Erysipelotrichaceae bacterium]
MMNNEELKNDAYLKEVMKKSGFSDDFIQEHFNLLKRIALSRALCKDCKGLYMCSQLSKGQRLVLNRDVVPIEEIEYCDYAMAENHKKELRDAYVYCDVPYDLLDLDLENVAYTEDQKQLYLKLAAILHQKEEKGLYICGDLGVGKTYLCTALANSLVKKGKKTAFVKVTDFFNRMRSFFNTDSQQIDRNIALLKKADYLFLDDIGSEAVSEFVRDDILFRILDYRLDHSLATLFTSNLTKEELLKHYQYDRKEKSNLMNAKRLMERIDIMTDDYVLSGKNMRRK